ncbi:MAG: hypothetical protein HRU46_14495 [Verrucomicrobiales bacterium]|nr:hypothetical protein [Verrucomicrobiales bacterium]
MKNDILILVVVLAFSVLFPVMCWAHRNVGTALITTIFAPLVIIPMGGLVWLIVGGVFKGFNTILEYFGVGMSESTIVMVAWIVTGVVALAGLVFYARDQRHLSTMKSGPRWGGARVNPNPMLNQKRFISG